MGKKLGKDYLLWIESVTPGTYNRILGQQELSYEESASEIDTTTKEDFPYGSSAPGARGITLNFSCIPDLPDATGFTRMETIAASATPQANFQVRKGGTAGAGGDVVFQCLLNINTKSTTMNSGSAVGFSAQLSNAAAPTTNVLA